MKRTKAKLHRHRQRSERAPAFVLRARNIDKFLSAFESLWKEIHGENLTIRYSHGWYGWQKFRYRRSQMELFYRQMMQEQHRREEGELA